jgi:hypothetical protein
MGKEIDTAPRYFPCSCHTAYHFLRFDIDPDIPDELYVSFVSTRNSSLWHRLRWAFKHVMGREDLVFADAIIERDSLEENLRYLAAERSTSTQGNR